MFCNFVISIGRKRSHKSTKQMLFTGFLEFTIFHPSIGSWFRQVCHVCGTHIKSSRLTYGSLALETVTERAIIFNPLCD